MRAGDVLLIGLPRWICLFVLLPHSPNSTGLEGA
jgi:hypothetical protein